MSELGLFDGIVPLVAVIDQGSFRGAAKVLSVTPSAVSKAVSRLEEELGVRLLHRTSRSVSLTPEGEAFVVRAKDAVGQLRAARDGAQQASRAVVGTLRASLPLSLARLVIAPALPRLLSAHPGLQLDLVLTDRKVSLADENIDLALRVGELDESGLPVRKLGRLRHLTVAHPDYLRQRGIPAHPSELGAHDCLSFVFANGRDRTWRYREGGQDLFFEPKGPLRADEGLALVEAARAGLGIVQAMDFMVQPGLDAGAFVEILAEFRPEGPPVAVVFAPGRRESPRVRVFVAFVEALLVERGLATGAR
jgi:LysR family transcriptional regulator for bpeEF and oprC